MAKYPKDYGPTPAAWRRAADPKGRLWLPNATRLILTAGAANERGGVRDEALRRVEAALFAADEPLSPRKLARLAELADAGDARRQVARLNRLYHDDNAAFHVEDLAGGYQLLTRSELRRGLDPFRPRRDEWSLSGPTLETLAIIAYRQPIARADIEAIRGVQVGELLRQLMDKGLVRWAGQDDSLGRPYLYGTTKQFLLAFGLRSLSELPFVEVLAHPLATSEPPVGK